VDCKGDFEASSFVVVLSIVFSLDSLSSLMSSALVSTLSSSIVLEDVEHLSSFKTKNGLSLFLLGFQHLL